MFPPNFGSQFPYPPQSTAPAAASLSQFAPKPIQPTPVAAFPVINNGFKPVDVPQPVAQKFNGNSQIQQPSNWPVLTPQQNSAPQPPHQQMPSVPPQPFMTQYPPGAAPPFPGGLPSSVPGLPPMSSAPVMSGMPPMSGAPVMPGMPPAMPSVNNVGPPGLPTSMSTAPSPPLMPPAMSQPMPGMTPMMPVSQPAPPPLSMGAQQIPSPQTMPPAQFGGPGANFPPPASANSFGVSQPMAPPNFTGNLVNDFQNMGFNHQPVTRYLDLLSERNLMKYDMADNEVVLPNSVCNPYVHCSPSVMRCTLSAIPESAELLNKCRMPLGLTIQPFKDLKNLTVIQTTIVRCRYCRTYINPYVYLSDNRHWKCNLCYRLNDLPEEFSWDPVSKSFGDPTRRPEIQNATMEYLAPSEYMLRDPQPALYLFILDVSANAVNCGYLHVFAEQLAANIELLPGDERTMIGFIGIDEALHFFQFFDVDVMPKHLIVSDVDEPFFPVNYGLFVELKYFKETITTFVQNLPTLFETNSSDGSCFGAALNIARDLISDIGGRVSAFLTTAVNVGPGAMNAAAENPVKNATKTNLRPSTDFYKSVALECTGKQIAVDLFVLGDRFVDLATLADVSKYSSGSVYHFPAFHLVRNPVEVLRFKRSLVRYFTRKIGFEAVLRIRCTKGVSLHTFHGNFFVRSTDLLALANVNPDAAMGVQVQIDENLSSQHSICFQAALLYTGSKGDRRIRVHTLCVPIERDIGKIFHLFDAKATISLLAKMAAERAMSGSDLSDCREALTNAACDALSAYNRSVGLRPSAIFAPLEGHLKFLALYTLGLLKHRAFSSNAGPSGSLSADERMAMMLLFKNAPLEKILLTIYPALYPIHRLEESDEMPPRLPLSYEHVSRDGVYLLDVGTTLYIFVCHSVDGLVLEKLFNVNAFSKIDEDASLELLQNPLSERLHEFIRHRFEARGKAFAPTVILREDGPNRHLFTSRLIEDRTESSHSYVEFLQVLKREIHSN